MSSAFAFIECSGSMMVSYVQGWGTGHTSKQRVHAAAWEGGVLDPPCFAAYWRHINTFQIFIKERLHCLYWNDVYFYYSAYRISYPYKILPLINV